MKATIGLFAITTEKCLKACHDFKSACLSTEIFFENLSQKFTTWADKNYILLQLSEAKFEGCC